MTNHMLIDFVSAILLTSLLAPIQESFAQDPVSFTNPRLVDAFGVSIVGNIDENQQVQFAADLENLNNIPQGFIYLV